MLDGHSFSLGTWQSGILLLAPRLALSYLVNHYPFLHFWLMVSGVAAHGSLVPIAQDMWQLSPLLWENMREASQKLHLGSRGCGDEVQGFLQGPILNNFTLFTLAPPLKSSPTSNGATCWWPSLQHRAFEEILIQAKALIVLWNSWPSCYSFACPHHYICIYCPPVLLRLPSGRY